MFFPSNWQCNWLKRVVGVSIPFSMGSNSDGILAPKIYASWIKLGSTSWTFFFFGLNLLMINLWVCVFSMTVWDSWDKTTPNSRIAKSVGKLVKFSVAMRFLIGYSSHRLIHRPPSPCLDQWVHIKNVFLELYCLLQPEFPVVSWQHLHLP